MNIEVIKNIVKNKWYYIYSSQDFWDNPKKFLMDFWLNFWNLLELNSNWEYSIDIKPDNNFNINHPFKWIKWLWLHLDGFFRELDKRPDYVLLLCINSWKWWETILCDIDKSIKDLNIKIWDKETNDILNTKVKPHIRGIQFWNTAFDIYQKFNWKIFSWKILEETNRWRFYTIIDNMDKDKKLKPLQDIIDSNIFTLSQLKKWEIIIINNTTFLHWRKSLLSNDRYFVRIQIQNI